ncbi:acyl-CoA/acyl-ACP dehydrogenase [Paenibacillus validus]|uniref:Acyl-CoA dehydrogenase n=1 Tax=Paenibacillus validus TaxID=44253 RepID=A0A7X2Z8Z4_9BACL|nr:MULTISPECIES: acyl-CoA dehydrogenase family protein [Paenibacillus]MED4601020.1 acyl-CoA/acyl-ACP dehydrogenase [Paenibacillus validus]MED4604933.1 acyl-CoA/acyl-ACP dehydrogenase [Paenibacillus validus]MUG69796.1 acyl-CoA dehydrogenase [Paenibacillus validus]
MNFEITDEQKMMRDGVRQIAEDFGLDYWREKDDKHEFVSELWSELGKNGYIGVAVPEKFGGVGLGMMEMTMVIEELAKGGAGSTVAQLFMLTPVFGGVTIDLHGSEAQKEQYLTKMSAGQLNFCMALTEPNAGSNSLEITTIARKEEDHYVINGQKIWISGADVADKMLIVARTTKRSEVQKKTEGISLFLVDTKDPAITLQPIEKVGTRCVRSDTVFIENLRVHKDNLIGEEGKGWSYLVDTLNAERIVTTAGLIGTGQLALQLAVNYAKERVVFNNTPIGAYQGIQFPLAKIRAELELAQLMNYKAAWLYDQKKPNGTEANMAKLIAAEAAFHACDRAMQVMGGYGYAKEYHIERLWRDVRLFKIAPVSEEMILNYISQHDLGLPRSY